MCPWDAEEAIAACNACNFEQDKNGNCYWIYGDMTFRGPISWKFRQLVPRKVRLVACTTFRGTFSHFSSPSEIPGIGPRKSQISPLYDFSWDNHSSPCEIPRIVYFKIISIKNISSHEKSYMRPIWLFLGSNISFYIS